MCVAPSRISNKMCTDLSETSQTALTRMAPAGHRESDLPLFRKMNLTPLRLRTWVAIDSGRTLWVTESSFSGLTLELSRTAKRFGLNE